MKNIGAYDYQYFKSSKKFQLDPVRAERQAHAIMEHFPGNVLDVGCGWGAVVKLLRDYGVEAYGVDNAEALRDIWNSDYFSIEDARALPHEDKQFDVVFSADFFEHVYEDEIELILDEMKRVGHHVIAEIAFEAPLTERQAKYHVTNKPKEWWKEKLPGVEIL